MYRPNDVVINGQRIQNVFNTQSHAFHSKYTRPIRGFWSLTKVLDLEPLMDETLDFFISNLTTRFIEPGKTCMMDDWLTYYAWDAAANVSFGKHYGFLKEGADVGGIIGESIAGLLYFAPVSQFPPLDAWLDKNPFFCIGPRPGISAFTYTVNILKEYAQGTLEKRKVDTFMDKYNALKDTVDFADDAQVVNWLMLNVLAGGDSTSGAMRSFVYHLAKAPFAYEKLIAELDAASLSLPAQWKEISALPYLNATILESMRISPALGLILEREAPAGGFTLPDGRFIPEGTKVGLNPCVVTRDVGVFGTNVATYDPDRWLQKYDESDEEFKGRYRRMQDATNLMFGAGSRVCMGQYLAKVEMYKLFATLYSVFDVGSYVFHEYCADILQIKLTSLEHVWKPFNAWFMYQRDIPMVITPRKKVHTGESRKMES